MYLAMNTNCLSILKETSSSNKTRNKNFVVNKQPGIKIVEKKKIHVLTLVKTKCL